jgi:aryl-alcohol dehydrogenase-like predicted oxidoreductase
VIRHAGLSEVSVAQIEAARRVFTVATVQNRFNLVDRGSETYSNIARRTPSALFRGSRLRRAA